MTKIPKMKYTWEQCEKDWHLRHFWWCWFWEFFHGRECCNYDGVCFNCRKDRYTGEKI
jgi:hypothetical protein